MHPKVIYNSRKPEDFVEHLTEHFSIIDNNDYGARLKGELGEVVLDFYEDLSPSVFWLVQFNLKTSLEFHNEITSLDQGLDKSLTIMIDVDGRISYRNNDNHFAGLSNQKGYTVQTAHKNHIFVLKPCKEIRGIIIRIPFSHLKHITRERIPELFEKLNDPSDWLIHKTINMELNELIADVFLLNDGGDYVGRYGDIYAKLTLILNLVFKNLLIQNPSKEGINQLPISTFIEIKTELNSNLALPPTMYELSKKYGMHEKQLRTNFKRVFNVTPAQYIMDTRLKRAQEELLNSSSTIQEISFDLGFSDAAHLSRLFKKTFGKTPSEFRG